MTAPTGTTGGSVTMGVTEIYHTGVTTIPAYAKQIADALETIATALEGLKYGWVGDSQKLADDFTRRWGTCAAALFGTTKNPNAGVLVRVADGLAFAGLNYGNTETAIRDSYDTFTQQVTQMLESAGNRTSATPPPPLAPGPAMPAPAQPPPITEA